MDDFRNRSAKSMLTLPLVAVIAGVVWVLPDPRSAWLWGGFAIVCALTYTLRELNNRFQLLRIRSRLVSATFLTLFAALPDLHPAGTNLIPAIGLLPALFCLFGSYQQYRPEHYTFHAFFFLSIGSLVFPPLLVLSVFFLCDDGPRFCTRSRGDLCLPDSSVWLFPIGFTPAISFG